MSQAAPDKFRQTDADARELARRLIGDARFGALGVLMDGAPFVTRVALAPCAPVITTLISELAPHTAALRSPGEASLLIGEPGKGDPLAHPRMTLQIDARFLEKTDVAVKAYLKHQPKAELYIGFADFHLVELRPRDIWLNGGFGKAYRLRPEDLAPT